jgi:hypothetical protein
VSDRVGGDAADRTGLALDYDRLTQPVGHFLRHDARDHVDVSARRKTVHHLDETGWILLGVRKSGECGQCGKPDGKDCFAHDVT